MLLKKYSKITVPLFLVLLGAITIVYFVNNPGGKMASHILQYKEIMRMLRQHILMVLISSTFAILFSVSMGIIITRPRLKSFVPFVNSTVNIAQTIPSLAILALFYTVLGLGFQTALFALFLYSLLPILRNTAAGIHNISSNIIEAAQGMGMSPLHILTRIELPLALPVIMTGIRVSVVVATGAAALATFIGAGGLGDLIVTGLSLRRNTVILAGGILTALLGILLDNLFGTAEQYIAQRGVARQGSE